MTNDIWLSKSQLSENIHIVLIESIESLNIGSAARAMKNLGFSNLHLVAPRSYSPEKAKVTACWADDIVNGAIIHSSLEEALSGMQEVVGFSAKQGTFHPGKLLLPEWIDKIQTKPVVKTAILFGPEDCGLNAGHIEHCHWLVRIPSTAECPSFNLAQSVLVALYELSRLNWAGLKCEMDEKQLPTWNEYYQLDRIVDEVLTVSGFFNGGPAPIPGLIKNLFRRMAMDDREMKVMLAVFGRIKRSLLHITKPESPN